MTTRPDIISIEEQQDSVLIHLHIPAGLVYFSGHFPGHPILPGVVQLQWAEQFARQAGLLDAQTFSRVERLKFMRVISVDYTVQLKLERLKPDTISFTYNSEHGLHSSGRIVFS